MASAAANCHDALRPNEISWNCNTAGGPGGAQMSNPEVTSFDFLDEVLRKLASKKIFQTSDRSWSPVTRPAARCSTVMRWRIKSTTSWALQSLMSSPILPATHGRTARVPPTRLTPSRRIRQGYIPVAPANAASAVFAAGPGAPHIRPMAVQLKDRTVIRPSRRTSS